MFNQATIYVRFVVGAARENPYLLTGAITMASLLRDEGQLQPYEVEAVDEAFAWFNEHLPCPPFGANLKSGVWTPNAVAWFKDSATEPIRQMWDIVALLRDQGIPVQFVQTETPGCIVYSDRYQIVAETPKYPIWDRH